MKELIKEGDNEQVFRFIKEVENIPIIKSFLVTDLDTYFSVFVFNIDKIKKEYVNIDIPFLKNITFDLAKRAIYDSYVHSTGKDFNNIMYGVFIKDFTNTMVETYRKKNHDYGNSFDKSLDEDGLLVAKIRIGDKINRYNTLKDSKAKVKDESIYDTLLDLANYCIMTIMWIDLNYNKQ